MILTFALCQPLCRTTGVRERSRRDAAGGEPVARDRSGSGHIAFISAQSIGIFSQQGGSTASVNRRSARRSIHSMIGAYLGRPWASHIGWPRTVSGFDGMDSQGPFAPAIAGIPLTLIALPTTTETKPHKDPD
jgi:hypothetical protein